MIVTLAGHVDHGKTTLVKLLTGTDTDRLAEEQRRGLTIDLGFAYLRNGAATLGFVDVPGHHRFIHNMVAGVAAHQQALLVVAADDGPMPQTREHLQILELLGVTRGLVALSKTDRVSAVRVAEARAQVAALLAGTVLDGAPIVPTSSQEAASVDALRRVLLERAADHVAERRPQPFRMAIDRVFTLKGTGLVATGTVHGGEVGVDQEVQVFPHGVRARVRGLRVQNNQALSAAAGDRTAVNLSGSGLDDLARGDWLCAVPDAGHRSVVVDLKVLDDFPRPLRHWTPVHVYHATSHRTARLALLQGSRLQPGAQGWAELVLDEPLLAKRGDRVVIRDHGLERTLGGGAVVDNRSPGGRRRAASRLRSISACAAPTAEAALAGLLEAGPVRIGDFQGLWHLAEADLESLLQAYPARRHEDWLVSESRWQQWSDALGDECEHRHLADASLQGLRENEFAADVPAVFRARLLGDLVTAGRLSRQGGRFRPPRHRASLSAAEQDLFDRLLPLLEATQPPSLGDLGKTLGMPLGQLQQALKALAGKGRVVAVSDKRVYLPPHLEQLAEVAEALSTEGPFSARQFRDRAGIGRNIAIDVLEYFDARGFTRRRDDVRSVVGERSALRRPLG